MGFELVAVLIPSEIQLQSDRWHSSLTGLGLDPDDYDPSTPNQIFETLLDRHEILRTSYGEANGVPLVDWTDDFLVPRPSWVDIVEDFVPIP